MSVRVNLLPDAKGGPGAASSTQRLIAVGLVVVVLAGLAVATVLQWGVLADAEDELAATRANLAAAQADVASLGEFAELELLRSETRQRIQAALALETTLAGVLQDLALVLPEEAALTTMAIGMTPQITEDGRIVAVGSVTVNVEVEDAFAPGMERLLLDIDRVAGFREVYPSGASRDEDDITTFSVTLQLGPEYLTGRYVDGVLEVAP